MPDENLSSQVQKEQETVTAPSSDDSKKWIKVVLFGIVGIVIIVGLVYAGYWYSTYTTSPSPTSNQQVGDEEAIKNLVLESISTFENVEDAEISFDQIEIKGNRAVVDIFIKWGRGLGVGYRQILTKEGGQWFLTSRERTIVE